MPGRVPQPPQAAGIGHQTDESSHARPANRTDRDFANGPPRGAAACRCSRRISAQSSTRIASPPALDHQGRSQAEITNWVTFDAPSEGQHSAVVEIPGEDPRVADDPVVMPAPSLRGIHLSSRRFTSLFQSRNALGSREVWLIRCSRCRCAVSRVFSNRYGRTWPATRRTAPYGSACPLARSPSATAPRASFRTGRRTCGRRNRPPQRRRDLRRR